jgi:restriction system protein
VSFPKQIDVELPLLKALADLGGEAPPREIYRLVASQFPTLTLEEQEERLESYPSTKKWNNLVQWARQRLVDLGEIDGSERGIWRMTATGRERLSRSHSGAEPATKLLSAAAVGPSLNLRDLVNANTQEIKTRLVAELNQLTSRTFEQFCREFLSHLGYRNVLVTRRSQDGGIDGHGDFRQGAISIRSAFQAKRWAANAVGRPEIDKFRGAIQGEYDHGVFLTTGRFSKDAKLASYKKGAITVLLLDGTAIAELLLERGLGVRRLPLYIYDIDDEFFNIAED